MALKKREFTPESGSVDTYTGWLSEGSSSERQMRIKVERKGHLTAESNGKNNEVTYRRVTNDQPHPYRPLSRRLDRCDRVIQNEGDDYSGYSNV